MPLCACVCVRVCACACVCVRASECVAAPAYLGTSACVHICVYVCVCVCVDRWSQPALRKALPDGVGNGGFSLRSARAMITVCERYSKTSPLKEQEDVFYGVHIMEDPQFRLGDRLSAYRFCLEVSG